MKVKEKEKDDQCLKRILDVECGVNIGHHEACSFLFCVVFFYWWGPLSFLYVLVIA